MRRGIALFIAMIFVVSISTLMLTNIKRVDSLLEESHLEVNLLQTNSLISDVKISLKKVIDNYGIKDQEDLDTMVNEARDIPIPIDGVRINIRLDHADYNKLDINKLVADTNSTDWQKVFVNIANSSNISGDANQLYSMFKSHIALYGEIRKESVLSRVLYDYSTLYGDSGIQEIRSYISVEPSGIIWDKCDDAIKYAIEDARGTREKIESESTVIKTYIPKFKTQIFYEKRPFKGSVSFVYNIEDVNQTTSMMNVTF